MCCTFPYLLYLVASLYSNSLLCIQETNPFTYVEINGLRIPDPGAAYNLLWEGLSGHDVAREGHLRVSSGEALKRLERYFAGVKGRGPGGFAWSVFFVFLSLITTRLSPSIRDIQSNETNDKLR